jgi:methyl-accepting chemotaxis protein
VLGALGLIAIGGYVYLKPIRDVASKINSTMEAAQQTVDQATAKAKEVANVAADKAGAAAETAKNVAEQAGVEVPDSAGDAMDGVLKSLLPGGAFVVYQQFAKQIKSGDFGGILSNLQDADMQGTLDQLKKLGNDDVTRVVDKVQSALDKAGGKVTDVDWKKLSQSLAKELPDQYQQWVSFLVGKVPSMDDFDKYVADAKKLGKEKLGDLNTAADKVYKKVQAASKDGKSVGDAFVEGVKETAPEDINKLVDQLRQTAKDAGLPADAIESYLRSKAVDSVDSAEKWARDIEKTVTTAAKWIPVEPETVVEQVSSISPALGKLLDEVLKDAKNKAQEGKKVAEDAAEKTKETLKKK